MKKITFILLALILTLCLMGCEEASENNETTLKEVKQSDVFVWTDEETGVQYIIYSDTAGYGGMGGITPRLNADGTLYIATKQKD